MVTAARRIVPRKSARLSVTLPGYRVRPHCHRRPRTRVLGVLRFQRGATAVPGAGGGRFMIHARRTYQGWLALFMLLAGTSVSPAGLHPTQRGEHAPNAAAAYGTGCSEQ